MGQPDVDDEEATPLGVHGRVVAAVWTATDCLEETDRRAARRTLAEFSLEDPDRESWYAHDALWEALVALRDATGAGVVSDLGSGVPVVVATEDCKSPADGLATLAERLHAVHRGGDVGDVEFRQIGQTDGRLECSAAYPCPFNRGVVIGLVDALGDGFVCLNEVGTCRDDGGDRCTYELSW